jgi:hypothetical protein
MCGLLAMVLAACFCFVVAIYTSLYGTVDSEYA